MHDLAATAYLFAPLLGGAVLHGLCMKHGWLGALTRPIDRGLRVRGRPLFGRNKTWRGPAAVGLGASLLLGLQADWLHALPAFRGVEPFDYGAHNGWLLGFALGFAAMLGELPNSFLKRQLDVAPGAAGGGWRGPVFYVLDQIDLLLGAWPVLALVMEVRPLQVLYSIGIFVLIHQAVTTVAYYTGMRTTPR